ncbi:MAG: hypothetical protein ACRC1K_20850, partial [Planctomycetia bacterium]
MKTELPFFTAPRRRPLLALAVAAGVCWTAAAAHGDDGPTAKIVGPVAADPGDLVVLDAGSSVGAGYAWGVVPAAKTFLPVDGGRRVVFASGKPGSFVFLLAVADGGKASLATHTVVVGPPAPPPAPGPPPEPNGLGLPAVSRSAAAAVAAARRSEAPALAAAQRSLAAAVAAGAYTTPGGILDAWRSANRAAADPAAWSGWGSAVGAALKRLYDAGRLTKPDDWRTAFEEIAAGLASSNADT